MRRTTAIPGMRRTSTGRPVVRVALRRGDKFWVDDDADAPPGSVPSTGPNGEAHDDRGNGEDPERAGSRGQLCRDAAQDMGLSPPPDPNSNADMLDAKYAEDPEAMKESDPSLAYYIGHGDHNPDGSG